MTDIIHTEPMTEEDMNKVRSYFARAADAIVDSSKLAKSVEELKNTMSELKQSYDEIAANNKFLLRQINTLENENTALKVELDSVKMERSHFNQRLAERDDEIRELHTAHNEQAETIARLRRESDEHMMRALKAEEVVDKVKGHFSVIKNMVQDFGDAFVEVEQLLYPAPETFLNPEPYPSPEVKEPEQFPTPPEGVTVVPLDEPREVHNAIAEAVGEPKIEEEKKEETFTDMPWRHGFASSAS
jgi:hypothetical protein